MRSAPFHTGLLALALLFGACASGPRYGSGKKRKECDCPKWSQRMPEQEPHVHVALADERITTPPPAGHAAHN